MFCQDPAILGLPKEGSICMIAEGRSVRKPSGRLLILQAAFEFWKSECNADA